MAKAIAKELFASKIYPTEDEIYNAAEDYLIKNHEEFFENLSEDRWALFYKNQLYLNVSLKIIFN